MIFQQKFCSVNLAKFLLENHHLSILCNSKQQHFPYNTCRLRHRNMNQCAYIRNISDRASVQKYPNHCTLGYSFQIWHGVSYGPLEFRNKKTHALASRSQGSCLRSKLAYFTHFFKLVLCFSSDHHQNWEICADSTQGKTY